MTAMDQEYEMVRKVLANNSKHQIVPVHCGWGKVNSAVNSWRRRWPITTAGTASPMSMGRCRAFPPASKRTRPC